MMSMLTPELGWKLPLRSQSEDSEHNPSPKLAELESVIAEDTEPSTRREEVAVHDRRRPPADRDLLMRRSLQEGNDALAPPPPSPDGPMVFTLSMVKEATYNDASKEGNDAHEHRRHRHRHRRAKLSLGKDHLPTNVH